jgi:hypothetical protein
VDGLGQVVSAGELVARLVQPSLSSAAKGLLATAKHEEIASVRIALELLLDQQGQALHTLPHVRVAIAVSTDITINTARNILASQ